MPRHIIPLTLLFLALAVAPSHAAAILLLSDHYTATAQVTVCAGACNPPQDVIEVITSTSSGSILGPSGPTTVLVTADALGPGLAMISIHPSSARGLHSEWEAMALASPRGFGPGDVNWSGSQFDVAWLLRAEGDGATFSPRLWRESSGNGTMSLQDLTLGTTLFDHSQVGFSPIAETASLEDGHVYWFRAALLPGPSGDPDIRLSVGANMDIRRVPEPSLVLLLGLGVAAAVARYRRPV